MTAVALNFHHLQYFWAVAREGNLTRAAERLRVAPSALSTQIRQLEAQLGQPLFERKGRALVLTEAGSLALSYAEEIFASGAELVTTLKQGRRKHHVLRVGSVATLSRNFQRSFVRPLMKSPTARLRLKVASLTELLTELSQHELDVVLSNEPAPPSDARGFRTRRLARQSASIVSSEWDGGFRFPQSLEGRPMILPSPRSELRREFDALCERLGVRVTVLAEVDDMATIRLLARDTSGLALVPSVVVRDELRDGSVRELYVVPDLSESFYAITAERRYQHPLLRSLFERSESELLADAAPPRRAR